LFLSQNIFHFISIVLADGSEHLNSLHDQLQLLRMATLEAQKIFLKSFLDSHHIEHIFAKCLAHRMFE
jgi:hypothetical protein